MNKWRHEFEIIGFPSSREQSLYLLENPRLYFNTSAHGFSAMHFDHELSTIIHDTQSPFLIDGTWSLSFFSRSSRVVQIPGWDLISSLLNEVNKRGNSRIQVIGADDTVIRELCLKYPKITWSAYTGIVDANTNLSEILVNDCDIILVALGSPKQDLVASKIQQLKIGDKLIIPVGIALAMDVGAEKSVPSRLTKFGLAWSHRLLNNPKKMITRFREILTFAYQSKTIFNLLPKFR